ncbi:GPW/gp25 family protein [Kordiimonas marina]|uniref:GPW/gp25 family protein n=1 Tax=Kordiimonas marina TaxID=2872312 RepID=UPI001FF28889|nr:GPW/gp25 family protein [Kordiimonas marina]MCJ9429312.1 GPW/gp25 family protein [Kordiimonas marina]
MTRIQTAKLPRVGYMAFPFRMGADGATTVARFEHIRQQVEQVLFTSPGERVFRPEFGFGARRHVFEPNASSLWEYAQNSLYGALAEALAGEVDPKTLQVSVGPGEGEPEVLLVRIRYVIAALQKEETHEIKV